MSQIRTFLEIIGPEKLKELREAAAPEGKKRLWMAKYCDDDQIAEMYYRLFERHDDVGDVARVARDIWGIQPHWDLRSFTNGLQTWKKRLSTEIDEVIDIQKTPTEKQKVMALRKKQRMLTSRLDALGRLGYAIELQTERMLMGHEIEQKAKTPLKFMDTIMGSLNEMVNTYVSLAIKTGALDSAPSEVNINLQAKSDFALNHVIGNDGKKFLRAADKFLTQIKEASVKMEWDEETQKYYPPELLAEIRQERTQKKRPQLSIEGDIVDV